jgi:hypothetical protein
MSTIAALCGTGVGLALILLGMSLKRVPEANDSLSRLKAMTRMLAAVASGASLRVAFAILSGITVAIVTGWPVAGLLSGTGALCVPPFLRATKRASTVTETEAIAVWTELLRDTLAGASGLAQAIVVTAPLAPEAIRSHTTSLAMRLSNGMPITTGLRMFADEIQDPGCDLVVCALILATTAKTQRVMELLGALAESMREEVVMRLSVESKRTTAKSGVRIIATFTIAFVALLVVVGRSYLEPFGTFDGELALLISGVCDAMGLLLMVGLVKDAPPLRLLESTNRGR